MRAVADDARDPRAMHVEQKAKPKVMVSIMMGNAVAAGKAAFDAFATTFRRAAKARPQSCVDLRVGPTADNAFGRRRVVVARDVQMPTAEVQEVCLHLLLVCRVSFEVWAAQTVRARLECATATGIDNGLVWMSQKHSHMGKVC